MRFADESREVRVLTNPQAVAERLAIWSEDARRAGRYMRADQLLLAAWEAFDLPSVSPVRRSDVNPVHREASRPRASRNWMDQAA